MDLGITGRKAIVAAASLGLGFGAAKALAAEGVEVAVGGRDRARLDDAVARLGGSAFALVGDVYTPDGAAHFVSGATDALGGADILITNAGGPPPASSDQPAPTPTARRLISISCRWSRCARRLSRGCRPGVGAGSWPSRRSLRPPAPTASDPVEHGSRRRHRVSQDARHRGGFPWRDRQLGAAGPPRHRPPQAALRREPRRSHQVRASRGARFGRALRRR